MPYLFDIKWVMQYHNNKDVRPTEPSVCPINLPFHPDRKVVARFDGGRLSSDADLVCVWSLDQQQGLTEDFAVCIRDVRDGCYIRHEISEMATQRNFQIVVGYRGLQRCRLAALGSDFQDRVRPAALRRSRLGLPIHPVPTGKLSE